MNRYIKCFAAIGFVAMLSPWVKAQELTLFEATEEPEQNSQNVVRQPDRTPRNSEPAFTLKGNSRFGDKYHTSLLHRDGNQVSVSLGKGQSAQIDGYLDYSVVGIDSRTVSLQLPASEVCVERLEKGVKCSNGNIAVLSLSTAAPLPARQETNNRNSNGDNGNRTAAPESAEEGAEVAQGPINPFSGEVQVIPEISEEERQARAERQAARAERLRNFQVNRIAPEDVPPGMRVVSTPFGDRLVPNNN